MTGSGLLTDYLSSPLPAVPISTGAGRASAKNPSDCLRSERAWPAR